MSRQVLKPGGQIEIPSIKEIAALIPGSREQTRIRANETVTLNASGAGQDEVYMCPAGYEFEVRRVVFSLTGNVPVDAVTGAVALNTAGHWVAYLRSGSLIEFAQPMYGSTIQVPGAQNWSYGQGPHIRNKEVFEVQALGLTASVVLSVYMEGDLTKPIARS